MSLIKNKIEHLDFKQLKFLLEQILQNILAIPLLNQQQQLNLTENFRQIEVLLDLYQQELNTDPQSLKDVNDLATEQQISLLIENSKDICIQLQQGLLDKQCNEWYLAYHLWRISKQVMIHILEPVVNCIAEISNDLRELDDLSFMADCIKKLLNGVTDEYRDDMLNNDPRRPWRVLLLNYCIVATRSHDVLLIENSYDFFAKHLPEDAAQFFTEAMSQMTALNYPQQVRIVVEKYYQQYVTNQDYKKQIN